MRSLDRKARNCYIDFLINFNNLGINIDWFCQWNMPKEGRLNFQIETWHLNSSFEIKVYVEIDMYILQYIKTDVYQGPTV